MSDYTFSFSLPEAPEPKGRTPNEVLGLHLKALLDIIVPTDRGRDMIPDGYRVLSDPEKIHPLSGTEDEAPGSGKGPLDLYEPRIVYIQRILEALLSVIDLEADGKAVSVDGFRLKDLKQWLTSSGGAVDILAHAASRCNLNCRFCYNQYQPPTLKSKTRPPAEEYREIQERIRQYVPGSKLNIFPTMGSPAEVLSHPHLLDILRELRKKTTEIFRISTNGSTLTGEIIQELNRFKPVYLDISLNSSSPERRAWLMQDPEPRIVMKALGMLQKTGIPYTVVIVPWPFPSPDHMIDDLAKTVSFADRFDPALIQISLPGYGRSKTSREERFSHENTWNRVRIAIHELRQQIECPLVIRPGLFEEAYQPDKVNDPVVAGVIKNSPARLAGLGLVDRILKVNGLPVRNIPQTRSLLTMLHKSELDTVSLAIQRQGDPLDLVLNLNVYDYPYTPESATQLGVVFASSGIPEEWIERVKEIVISRKAREVLLLSSSLVRPVLQRILFEKGFIPDVNLHIHIPQNRYFGGNIFMGDLLVVEDFIAAIEAFTRQEKIQPDLVLIPSSPFHLSGWGRDLTGRVYLEIERRTKVPVELIECETIYD